LIDWQLIDGWGTDSSNTKVLDFTTIHYTIIVSYSHLNYNNNNLEQYWLIRCKCHFYESRHRSLWSLQITITLTEGALLIFLQSGVKKFLAWAAGDWTWNLRSLFTVRCLRPLSHSNPTIPGQINHQSWQRATIMLDDYFKTNSGVKDLPWPELNPSLPVHSQLS